MSLDHDGVLTLGQIVSTDDYMPMAINSKKDYENVVNVSWFTQEQSADDLT